MSNEPVVSINESSIKTIRKILLSWGTKNYKDFPWRRTDNKWHALLAEALLQRTKAKAVIPVYSEMISRYDKPADLANAPLSDIEEVVYSLGLPARASILKNLAGEIVK